MAVLVDSNGTYNNETLVKYYYVEKSAGVVEKHIDSETNTIIKEIKHEGNVGDKYVISESKFDGYEILKDKYPSNKEGTISNIQLELGSTATDYEPHAGQTYDIAFPTEAGTVYGGTLDVTTGVLTVDRAQIASYAGETLPSTWISDRDVYSAGATPTTGAQVVYELATPITYHLTPQEITTLLGQNNIWADTGDMSVTYRADTKLYIDKKFTKLQALILEN